MLVYLHDTEDDHGIDAKGYLSTEQLAIVETTEHALAQLIPGFAHAFSHLSKQNNGWIFAMQVTAYQGPSDYHQIYTYAIQNYGEDIDDLIRDINVKTFIDRFHLEPKPETSTVK